MLVSVIPQVRSASILAMDYVIPLGFVLLVWSVASSYAITSALCFVRREVLVGIWMLMWVLVLVFVSLAVVRFLIN
jgi:hypothetical protein